MYPAYGNLVPRDVASRAIYKVVVHMGLGMHNPNRVYLDLSHIPADYLERKLGGILEMYDDFVGKDPRKVPMEIFPSIHYSMGGIWVDREHHTNIPGLMASGECDYQYHGANRLGANSLLSAAYSGTISGPESLRLARSGKLGDPLTDAEMEEARQQTVDEFEKILQMNGPENAHQLHHELGDIMYKYVSVERDNDGLAECVEELKKILKRWDNIGITDRGHWANQEAMFVRQLRNMIIYAMAITQSALQRDESRGAHAKIVLESDYAKLDDDQKAALQKKYGQFHFDKETGRGMTDDGNNDLVFFERNDKQFMRTTIVTFDKEHEAPVVSYREFEHSLIKPRLRNYAVAKKE